MPATLAAAGNQTVQLSVMATLRNRPDLARARLITALAGLVILPGGGASAQPPPAAPAGAGTLTRPDSERVTGRIAGDARAGFVFQPDGGRSGPIPLKAGASVAFAGADPGPSVGLPPFRVDLGLGQRLSGRLVSLDAREIVLGDPAQPGGKVVVNRAGADALVQRRGEHLTLDDGFETLDKERWRVVGEPEVVDSPKLSGAHSLRIPADGGSVTCRLPDAVASGRLDAAFYDDGSTAAGQKWFVDLTFRNAGGTETVRAVLGWSEDSLAVETEGDLGLAVQRLARSKGWHRLSLRFGPGVCEVSVDGNELAHGKGFAGPLVEVRLAGSPSGRSKPPDGLSGYVDDLRLIRFVEPSGELEVDATQDEVRLAGGDQVFGTVGTADPSAIEATADGSALSFRWSEVSGLYFKRTASQGAAVSGLLVRAEWKTAPGTDPRDVDCVEGALAALTPAALVVDTPYAGRVGVPRERLTRLSVLGEGVRLVVDPKAHHLGDEVSTKAQNIDPPQPEGGVLERSVTIDRLPDADAALVLDVVQVVGESPDLPYSGLIRRGELRTNLVCNGTPFDYINRFIVDKNETPQRVRIPLPKALLKAGRNVIRFEQVGKENEPNYLDDLGLLGVALEFATRPRR